jgi:hypothetical protein
VGVGITITRIDPRYGGRTFKSKLLLRLLGRGGIFVLLFVQPLLPKACNCGLISVAENIYLYSLTFASI